MKWPYVGGNLFMMPALLLTGLRHRPLQPWGCNKHPATKWGNNPSLK